MLSFFQGNLISEHRLDPKFFNTNESIFSNIANPYLMNIRHLHDLTKDGKRMADSF